MCGKKAGMKAGPKSSKTQKPMTKKVMATKKK